MKETPLQKRTPGASVNRLQKFIHTLFQAPCALIVLSLTLTLTGIAWYYTQWNIENNAHARFDRRVVRASRAIEERIQIYINTLLSTRSLFAVNQNITRADWKRYTETLQMEARYPGIYSLVFARYVPGSQRTFFEKQVRNDTSLDPKGYPDFSIHPKGERPDYFPIEYTEPFSPLPVQFGFDIGSDPVRRQALEQARDTGQPVSTGRIVLVGLGETGFSVRVPVYRNGLPHSTVEERRRALLGFVAAAFQMEHLMKGIFSDNAERDLQFEIFDGGTEKGADPLPLLTKERLLYDSDGILTADTTDEQLGDTQTASLTIAGRIWYLYFSTRSDFRWGTEERLPFLILFGGISFSFLLSYITWSTTTARRRAIDLAETMTADLRESEERFRVIFDRAPSGIAVVTPQGGYLDLNEKLSEMMGYTKEELLGLTFQDVTHPEDLTANLALKKRLLAGEIGQYKMEKRYLRKDGRIVWANLTVSPIYDCSGKLKYLVAIVDDITDRKGADERLRQSEEKYRLLFENNPHPMWVFDLETLVFLAVNQAVIRNYGYRREEFLSMTIKDICPSEDLPTLIKALPQISTRVGPGGIWRNRKKDGTVINVEITSDIISFSGRKAKLVLANDVTERLRAEGALRQSEEQYRLLFDQNPHPMWVVDPSTHTFLAVNEAAIRHYGYSREAFLQMTICDIRPPEEVPLLLQYLKEVSEREFPSDPVMGGVWTHRKKDGSLIEAEITWNLILFRGKEARLVLAEDVTESRKTERELQDSERRFRQLAENIHEIFWIVELLPFRMLYISPAYEQIWGRTCQSLYDQPKSFLDAVHPEDRVRVLDAMEQQSGGESTDTEYRIIRTDGSVRWVRDRGFPIKDGSGKVYRVAGVAEDITERRQAEQALRETNETLRTLIHSSPLAIFALDSEGRVKMWNPAAERLFGWEEEEILGRRFPILLLDQDEELDLLRRLVLEGKGFTGMEGRHPRKDGMSVDISISVAPLPGSEPMTTGIVAVVADISDRKKTEEALRKSEERFHLATRATNDAVWDWNLVTDALWWNENLQTLFGYKPEEIEPGIESWTNRLYPEDKERVLSGIHTAIAGGDQLWSGEYRFRRGDGSYATVLDRGYIVRDAAGAPLRMIGAMMDITERKHAEEALRIKTEQLAAVTDAMTAYLNSRDWNETSSRLLRSALHQTQSEYGFIGMVVEGPRLRIIAHEGVDWDAVRNRSFYEEALQRYREQGYLDFDRFDNLFGEVIRTGKGVVSNDVAADPRSGGVPPGHPTLRTFLGVPIIRENQVVGIIGVANRPGGYSGAEQNGIEILCHATGILYDSYRRREREIALENQQQNVEKELRRSQEQLRNLSSRLHSMVEEERTRISREIHDELGQLLTILKMELSWLKKRLSKKEALLRDRTKSMAKLVDTTVQTLRKISTELRPGVLDDLGLTAAIEWQVQEFQSRTGMRCRFAVRPEEILLDPDRSTAVFRIFQETLTNIVRHANADEVAILLEKTEESLILEVKDNGRGITQSQITNSKSLGLLGIRERALLWGGTVQISGVPGKGTIITVQIPLHQPNDAGMKA